MIDAYIYLRVSGKEQVDGDGFPRQRIACTTFTAGAGLNIVQEFCEKAVQGKTEWEDRPEWVRMMIAATAAGVTTIIIERLDRLARDLMVQEHIIKDLQDRGFTLLSTMEPDLCSDDPTRKLFRQIMGAIAEYDRAMLVLKLLGSRQRKKAETGRCEGRKPFGFRAGEHKALEMMRALRAGGMTTEEIAGELNKAGISSRYSDTWRGTTIAKILRRDKAE